MSDKVAILGTALTVAAGLGAASESVDKSKKTYRALRAAHTYSPSTGQRKMANSIMTKVAELRPDVVEFISSTKDEVNDSPYRDEILTAMGELIKSAEAASGWKDTGKNVLQGAAALMVAGVASDLASDLYDSVKRGLSRSTNFKTMMKSTPDLREFPKKEVANVFGVLHRAAPALAANPTIAGSFVKNQLNLAGDIDIQSLKTLTDTQEKMMKSRARFDFSSMPADMGEAAKLKDQVSTMKADKGKDKKVDDLKEELKWERRGKDPGDYS